MPKNRDLEIRVTGVTQGHRKWYHSIWNPWLPINGPYNHRHISHRFRDKQRFKSKIANFPTPMYFAPPLTGLPLELGIGPGVRKKTGMIGLPDGRESFKTGLAV